MHCINTTYPLLLPLFPLPSSLFSFPPVLLLVITTGQHTRSEQRRGGGKRITASVQPSSSPFHVTRLFDKTTPLSIIQFAPDLFCNVTQPVSSSSSSDSWVAVFPLPHPRPSPAQPSSPLCLALSLLFPLLPWLRDSVYPLFFCSMFSFLFAYFFFFFFPGACIIRSMSLCPSPRLASPSHLTLDSPIPSKT